MCYTCEDSACECCGGEQREEEEGGGCVQAQERDQAAGSGSEGDRQGDHRCREEEDQVVGPFEDGAQDLGDETVESRVAEVVRMHVLRHYETRACTSPPCSAHQLFVCCCCILTVDVGVICSLLTHYSPSLRPAMTQEDVKRLESIQFHLRTPGPGVSAAALTSIMWEAVLATVEEHVRHDMPASYVILLLAHCAH